MLQQWDCLSDKLLFNTLKSFRFSNHLLRAFAFLSKLQFNKNIAFDSLEKQVVMRVTLSSSQLSSQLVKNSQRQNRNQHNKVTCLLILNVRVLVRTLKNDRKMREMKKSRNSQTSDLNESESSAFKKARRSRVKFSSKKFVRDSCSENDDEENNSDDVATERFTLSKSAKQLKVSKMSNRQSRMILSFQTTSQLHRESMKDSLRRSKETWRKINDSENHDDEDDDEEEEDEENRETLNENNAMNVSNKSFDEALRSLSEVHSNKSTLTSQTLSTARRRIWSETERLDNERSKAHCSTCTCSSSSTQ